MGNVMRSVVDRLLVRVIVAVVIAVVAVFAAHAQSTDSCQHVGAVWYKYGITLVNFGGPTGYVLPSLQAACALGQSTYCGNHPISANCVAPRIPWNAVGTDSCSLGTSPYTDSFPNRQSQANPVTDCPAAPPPEVVCDLPASPEVGIANFAPSAAELDPIACDMGTNCVVTKRPGTTVCGSGPTDLCGAIYNYLESPCNGTTVPEDNTPPELASGEGTPAERCHNIGDGEYCVTTGGPEGNDAQCGYLNGDFTCVTATPRGGCQAAGGGALCDPLAASPPAPDSGTPGVEAAPDGGVETSAAGGNTTNTYNYFNGTTVAASSSPVVYGTVDHGNDQNGDGYTDPEEEQAPTGTAGGGGTCLAEPTCDGDAIACAILLQEWKARCVDDAIPVVSSEFTAEENAGLGSSAEEVEIGSLSAAGILSAGSCPAATNITVHGQSLSLDIWGPACTMATLFAPFVMMMAYFMAAMIFFKG